RRLLPLRVQGSRRGAHDRRQDPVGGSGRHRRSAAAGADVGSGQDSTGAVNLDELHRREWGRMLATLIRVVGDFDLAEDALQEAFEAALAWGDGPPANPVAWLISTARHKAIDQIRRRALAERKQDELTAAISDDDDQ